MYPNYVNMDKYIAYVLRKRNEQQQEKRQIQRLEWLVLSALQLDEKHGYDRLQQFFLAYEDAYYESHLRRILCRVDVTDEGIYYIAR